MSTASATNNQNPIARPGSVRAIFLLTMSQILISLAFYIAFATGNAPVEGIATSTILYTMLAYIGIAIPIFIFIHKHNLLGVRIGLIVLIAASIPSGGFIGMALSLVSLGMTFTKSAKEFLTQ